MAVFNVIIYDPNHKKFVPYNVIPCFVRFYHINSECADRKKPSTFEEFKKFIIDEGRYHFWGRCEYEIILSDWPTERHQEKWDIYGQITLNIDIITQLVIEELKQNDLGNN